MAYKPGIGQAINVFHAMRNRKTTKPEDRVYSLLSALNIDIPIEYGEGFDSAFYRLQVEILTRTNDRRLLLWPGGASSSYNSMLSGDFATLGIHPHYWISPEEIYRRSSITFDPTISFDSKNTMRVMVGLYPLQTSFPDQHFFALRGYLGRKICRRLAT